MDCKKCTPGFFCEGCQNESQVELLDMIGTKRDIADAARNTINQDAGNGTPSDSWYRRMLLCEHSPIRLRKIIWKWKNLKSWISVHFVRHKFGIEHWVGTQRDDRTNVDRNASRQDTPVMHQAEANTQAIINVSRKRLCTGAHAETRAAWKNVLAKINEVDPILVSVCVPDCIYRGWCYEYKSCGYHLTPEFKERLAQYRRDINVGKDSSK